MVARHDTLQSLSVHLLLFSDALRAQLCGITDLSAQASACSPKLDVEGSLLGGPSTATTTQILVLPKFSVRVFFNLLLHSSMLSDFAQLFWPSLFFYS
jgi:hypothetical protein